MQKHNKQQRRPVALAITMTLAPQYGTTEPDAPVVLPEITVTGAPPDTIGYKTTRATTATKTDTPIFDLPVSIQVVPREVLDDRQGSAWRMPSRPSAAWSRLPAAAAPSIPPEFADSKHSATSTGTGSGGASLATISRVRPIWSGWKF
jgi:hypothetical protein